MAYNSRKTFSQQVSGIGFVILLHIVVVYIVASGLGTKAVQVVMGPIETRVIEEKQKPTEEAPPPPPKIETPPPYIPPPEIDIAMEISTTPTTAIQTVTNVKAPPAPPPPPVADVAPRTNPRRPNSIPPYPSASQRLGEEGVVTLNLYVLENGRVGDARVDASSGFPRLDEAAVNYSKARWSFIPGTRAGKPAAMWYQIKVRFELKK